MAHVEEPRRNADGTWSTRVRYRLGGRGTPLLGHPVLGMASREAALEAAQHWANNLERKKYLGELSREEAGHELTCGEFVELWMRMRVVTQLRQVASPLVVYEPVEVFSTAVVERKP